MTRDSVWQIMGLVVILFSDLCSKKLQLKFATFVEGKWDANITCEFLFCFASFWDLRWLPGSDCQDRR
ncbi:MAG TPA: hypothetical protein VIW07_12370, partial [Candidatus Udaeobacter sp.]